MVVATLTKKVLSIWGKIWHNVPIRSVGELNQLIFSLERLETIIFNEEG